MSLLLRLLCLGWAFSAAGCASVAPWERGALADRWMQVEPCVGRAALRDHALAAREGAQGGNGDAGGGCGCD
jgi:hypothetical protein